MLQGLSDSFYLLVIRLDNRALVPISFGLHMIVCITVGPHSSICISLQPSWTWESTLEVDVVPLPKNEHSSFLIGLGLDRIYLDRTLITGLVWNARLRTDYGCEYKANVLLHGDQYLLVHHRESSPKSMTCVVIRLEYSMVKQNDGLAQPKPSISYLVTVNYYYVTQR